VQFGKAWPSVKIGQGKRPFNKARAQNLYFENLWFPHSEQKCFRSPDGTRMTGFRSPIGGSQRAEKEIFR
jgi:hypothetical protein